MSSFDGQVAVVTGGSRGIGRAIALRLAADGAVVCMIGRDRAALEAVGSQAGEADARLIPFPADLEKDEDIHSAAVRLRRSFGGLDILVHSAGILLPADIASGKAADFDRQVRVNARAPYLLTQALIPMMRARKGQVVFINSTAGLRSKRGLAAYCASKHALKAVADALREEVGCDGLRVISVYPGRTATRMQQEVLDPGGSPGAGELLLRPEDVAAVVVDALRLDRNAEVTDLFVRPAAQAESNPPPKERQP